LVAGADVTLRRLPCIESSLMYNYFGGAPGDEGSFGCAAHAFQTVPGCHFFRFVACGLTDPSIEKFGEKDSVLVVGDSSLYSHDRYRVSAYYFTTDRSIVSTFKGYLVNMQEK